jgi:hypothetical protein
MPDMAAPDALTVLPAILIPLFRTAAHAFDARVIGSGDTLIGERSAATQKG